MVNGAVKGLEGWVACFERARLAGVLRATGINDPGEASTRKDMLTLAHEMGRRA